MPEPREDRSPIPGTPGYVAEAAQRHHEFDSYNEPEVRSTQLIPEPLQELEDVGGPGAPPRIAKMRDQTRHQAK